MAWEDVKKEDIKDVQSTKFTVSFRANTSMNPRTIIPSTFTATDSTTTSCFKEYHHISFASNLYDGCLPYA